MKADLKTVQEKELTKDKAKTGLIYKEVYSWIQEYLG